MLFRPSHPGEVLKDYLGYMTVKEAAHRLGVTRPNLSRILNGRAGISAAMSVRLAKAMPYTSLSFGSRCSSITIFGKPGKTGCQESDRFQSRSRRTPSHHVMELSSRLIALDLPITRWPVTLMTG